MPIFVIMFFIITTVCALIAAMLFEKKSAKESALNYFGKGLFAGGLAFTIWTMTLILRMMDLTSWVWIGVLIVFAGSLFFIGATTANWHDKKLAKAFLITAAVFDIILFGLRFFWPSQPYISEQGMFFFNPNPYIGFLDIVFLVVAILPATLAAAKEMIGKNQVVAIVFQSAMVAILVGVIMLLTNFNTVYLNLTGWVMGIAFLALLFSSIFLKPVKN